MNAKSANLGRKVNSLEKGVELELDLLIEGSHKRSINVKVIDFNFDSELLCRTGFVYRVIESGDVGNYSFISERFKNITPFYYDAAQDIYYEITMD